MDQNKLLQRIETCIALYKKTISEAEKEGHSFAYKFGVAEQCILFITEDISKSKEGRKREVKNA